MNATLWPVFGGFAIFLLLASASLSSASEPYPVPGEASARFEVRLDGVAVPVVAYKDIHYCHFRLDGAGEIEIIAKDGPVTSARLQPASRCLAAKIVGSAVRFAMPGPMSLVAQLDFREKLFLFADGPADAVTANALNAAKLGAVGDGQHCSPPDRSRSTSRGRHSCHSRRPFPERDAAPPLGDAAAPRSGRAPASRR
jgi:hypothetical protein